MNEDDISGTGARTTIDAIVLALARRAGWELTRVQDEASTEGTPNENAASTHELTKRAGAPAGPRNTKAKKTKKVLLHEAGARTRISHRACVGHMDRRTGTRAHPPFGLDRTTIPCLAAENAPLACAQPSRRCRSNGVRDVASSRRAARRSRRRSAARSLKSTSFRRSSPSVRAARAARRSRTTHASRSRSGRPPSGQSSAREPSAARSRCCSSRRRATRRRSRTSTSSTRACTSPRSRAPSI